MRVSPKLTRSIRPGLLVASLGLAAAVPQAAQAQAAPSAALAASAAPEAAEIQRLFRSGQSAQALKIIDAALARNPKDPLMRFRRGVALSMLDRKADAISMFQGLIQDYPTMPAPYNNLAVLYGSQGDYEKARVTLEKALRANPETATAYENLGDVYAQLASQAYEKALQLKKPDASTPVKLGLLRELVSTPEGSAAAALAASARGPGTKPTQVAVASPAPLPIATPPAPAPAPAPSPAAVTAPAPLAPPPGTRPTPSPVPAPAAVPAPAPARVPAPAPAPATVPAPAPAPASRSTPTPVPAPVAPPAIQPVVVATAPPTTMSNPSAARSAGLSAAPVSAASPVAHPPSAAAPAPAPVASPNAVAEVESAVRAWAQAWSRRDVPGYAATYTPDFTGSARNHRAWEDDRRARIEPRKHISVELSELRVSVAGDTAEAHFRQTYQSDTLNNTVHKTLTLVRSPSGKWLIRREIVGG